MVNIHIHIHIYRVTPTISEIKPDITSFTKSFKSAVKIRKACGADNITAQDLKLHESTSIAGMFKVYKKKCSCWSVSIRLENCQSISPVHSK